MGLFNELGRLLDNLVNVVINVLEVLIETAICLIAAFIDLVTDILSWINGKLEMLLNQGAKEVNILDGEMLAKFVKEKQATGQCREISLAQLQALKTSTINVAMNGDRIVDQQMIRSQSGLSAESRSQFQGQPVMKIKIPA